MIYGGGVRNTSWCVCILWRPLHLSDHKIMEDCGKAWILMFLGTNGSFKPWVPTPSSHLLVLISGITLPWYLMVVVLHSMELLSHCQGHHLPLMELGYIGNFKNLRYLRKWTIVIVHNPWVKADKLEQPQTNLCFSKHLPWFYAVSETEAESKKSL